MSFPYVLAHAGSVEITKKHQSFRCQAQMCTVPAYCFSLDGLQVSTAVSATSAEERPSLFVGPVRPVRPVCICMSCVGAVDPVQVT